VGNTVKYMEIIKTLALVVIAICYVANTIEVYTTEDGGNSYFFGNIGYYVETTEEDNP